ncbi:hypothetical protein [Chelativorans intermedius]|uniref:Uncharacterized protein n=1 Tax=Chelativorans intermedius TaxID=515947 RepID=A0ABV6DDI9_9HYPH
MVEVVQEMREKLKAQEERRQTRRVFAFWTSVVLVMVCVAAGTALVTP